MFVYSALRYTWQCSVNLQWLKVRENLELFSPCTLPLVAAVFQKEGRKTTARLAGEGEAFTFNREYFFTFLQVLCKTALEYTVHPGSRGTAAWGGWIPLWVFAHALRFHPVPQYRANPVLPLHQASVPSDCQVQTSHPVLPSELKTAETRRWVISAASRFDGS